jgi:hypothetical protein
MYKVKTKKLNNNMTDTTKRYRLKQNINMPYRNLKAGTIGVETIPKGYVSFGEGKNSLAYSVSDIKNCPDYFEEVAVIEPVKERLEPQDITNASKYWEQFRKLPIGNAEMIMHLATYAKQNQKPDTVVEKSFDAMVREMNESHARYIADNSPVKLFTESEVDAIRADTWKAAREQNGFDSLRWTSFDAYLTSLNLNTNDTGKEDIRDNKINLLEEDLAVVHHYLDDLSVPRKHEGGDAYSIVGRIKQLELYYMKKLSEIESEYLSKQQPTNDNAFVWTDSLVMEIIGLTHRAGYHKEPARVYDRIQSFRQSKQSAPEPSALPDSKQEEKQWEIVSLHHKNDSINKLILSDKKDCYYWSGGELNKNPLSIDYVLSKQDFIIHSVRRLSDNTVWTVKGNSNKGIIESFLIITEENSSNSITAHLHRKENIGKIAVKVIGDLGATFPNQLLEDLELPTPTQPVVETISSDNTDVAILSVNDVMGFFRAYFDTKASMHPTHGEIRDAMIEVAKQKLNK